jgi:hypothetical protein
MDADGSAAPITPMKLLLKFQESRKTFVGDPPKVANEAGIVIHHISLVEMSKPKAGKLPALMTEVHDAFRE